MVVHFLAIRLVNATGAQRQLREPLEGRLHPLTVRPLVVPATA